MGRRVGFGKKLKIWGEVEKCEGGLGVGGLDFFLLGEGVFFFGVQDQILCH